MKEDYLGWRKEENEIEPNEKEKLKIRGGLNL